MAKKVPPKQPGKNKKMPPGKKKSGGMKDPKTTGGSDYGTQGKC